MESLKSTNRAVDFKLSMDLKEDIFGKIWESGPVKPDDGEYSQLFYRMQMDDF